jgi:hypothetical protein
VTFWLPKIRKSLFLAFFNGFSLANENKPLIFCSQEKPQKIIYTYFRWCGPVDVQCLEAAPSREGIQAMGKAGVRMVTTCMK